MLVKFSKEGQYTEEILEKGHHFVEVDLNEVPLFIREGRCIPLVKAARCVEELDSTCPEMIGFEGAEYLLYEDDGFTKDYDKEGSYRKLKI